MKTCLVSLESTSPYSQSRAHETPKLNKESPADYDDRTWREHCHTDKKTGKVYIPANALKQSVQEAAAYLAEKIKGKGMKTWTEKFRSGIIVDNNIILDVTKDRIACERVHCHANGKRGSGSRVYRKFPVVDQWKGDVLFHILDDEITEEVFLRTVKQAGLLIGIGRWRAKNGGQNGRFAVTAHDWQDAQV